jgi:hypothetical protein
MSFYLADVVSVVPVPIYARSKVSVLVVWLLGLRVRFPLETWMFVFYALCCPVSVEAFTTI